MRAFTSIATALLVLGGAAIADEDPRLWLGRMGETIQTRNYVGTFVHVTLDAQGEWRNETMRVVHRVDGGRTDELLTSLDGEPTVIVRRNGETKCILGSERVVVAQKEQSPLIKTLPAYNEQLDPFYGFRLGVGTHRVVNRPARLVRVEPKDRFRYGYKLWLDEQTAMPLKSIVVGEKGAVVKKMFFTEISFPDTIDDADLEPPISGEGFEVFQASETEQSPAVENAETRWYARPPGGFELSVSSSTDEHLVYTDGVATVSVFIQSLAGGESPGRSMSKLGATNAFTTTISGYQVTVVGEVPTQTVEAIGESVQQRDPLRSEHFGGHRMIVEHGRVVDTRPGSARVSCESHLHCERCAAGRGCGGLFLGRLLGGRLKTLRASTGHHNVHPGDRVVVGVAESALLWGALAAYGFPVLGLLAGAALGHVAAPAQPDFGAALGAVGGLAVSLGLVRRLSRRLACDQRFEPVIVARLSSADES